MIEVKDLSKRFAEDTSPLFQGLSLVVESGESVAIMGSSGVGKSTLLHILGHLDTPTSGEILFDGKKVEIPSMFRNQQLGFIFQSYHLLEDFSVLDNVLMPLRIGRQPLSEKEWGMNLLKRVGLEEKAKQLASTLSGGEKQRVAIARALCNRPKLVLADEPTGNLDAAHSEEIQKLLLSCVQQEGMSLIVVTHDPDFAKMCDRSLFLKDGRLYTESK